MRQHLPSAAPAHHSCALLSISHTAFCLAVFRAPLELQTVVDGQGAIADVEAYIASLGLGVVSNLDPKPENRVFAAKFGGVPIMLRLEAHAASRKVRFTIRTTHAVVTSCILATVTAALPT